MLVIDDEDSICLAFKRFFGRRSWSVRAVATAAEGMAVRRELRPSVVFLDVRLPDRNGLDVLDELADGRRNVIVITAFGGLDTVVRAIQGRAYDCLAKPLDLDRALELAERIHGTDGAALRGSGMDGAAEQGGAHSSAAPARNGLLRSAVSAVHGDPEQEFVGNSAAMQSVYKMVARAGGCNSPVLIEGETGAGKELAARAIHRHSDRRDGPLIAVNCGAIPDNLIESELFGHVRGAFTGADTARMGRFEAAEGGSLLLDEIGELPQAVQVKLLRVLDTGVVEPVGSSRGIRLNVRILAATNRNLRREVESGGFRRDLYYRLAVLQVHLPPLRERVEDIAPIAVHLLHRAGHGGRLTNEAISALEGHDWPGNVRELRNALAHAMAHAPDGIVRPEHLPESTTRWANPAGSRNGDATDPGRRLREAAVDFALAAPDGRCRRTIEQAERALIEEALRRCGGNQCDAAAYLGLHRNTLRKKLQQRGAGDGR